MALSEIQQRTISLGKQMVESLDDSEGVDSFSSWMAHYIAELITKAESATGAEEESAQEKCFEAILRLWKNRSLLPPRLRPFERFDVMLETLERLNPEDGSRFYGRFSQSGDDNQEIGVEQIMDWTMAVDQSARSLISELFAIAVEDCADAATKSFLENSIEDLGGRDIDVVRQLLARFGPSEETDDERNSDVTDRRVEILDDFSAKSAAIRKVIEARREDS